MKKRTLIIESLLATVLVFFVVLLLFSLISISFKPFNYVVKSIKEFNLNDLYFSSLSNNLADTNIVIINIEHIGRDGISELLLKVAESDPAVIGLDVFFLSEIQTPYDGILSDILQMHKEMVVLPLEFGTENQPSPIYWTFDESFHTGQAGILTNYGNTEVVREFSPFMEIDNQRVNSFAATVAKVFNPDAYKTLEKRGKKTEKINYIGNTYAFRTFHYSDVLNFTESDRQLIQDKIILLGYYGGRTQSYADLDDVFFTPVGFDGNINRRPDMFGVVIHANIISMILNERYINTVPSWLIYLIAFIITFLHIIGFVYFYVKKHLYYHTFAKICLLFSSTILLLLVFILFSLYQLYFPAKYLLLPVVLSVDVLYLYETIALFLYKLFGIQSAFVKH